MDAVVREALSDVQDMERQVLGAEDHEAHIIFSLMAQKEEVVVADDRQDRRPQHCEQLGKQQLHEKAESRLLQQGLAMSALTFRLAATRRAGAALKSRLHSGHRELEDAVIKWMKRRRLTARTERKSMPSSSSFCKDTFCPAVNAAWPHELNSLCRQLVAPQIFGSVINDQAVPAEVKRFCVQFIPAVQAELPGSGADSSATISTMYANMLVKCADCVRESWACLTPESYCERVGNEKGSIASGLNYEYGGDSSQYLGGGDIRKFTTEHECNKFCLASADAGLQPISSSSSSAH